MNDIKTVVALLFFFFASIFAKDLSFSELPQSVVSLATEQHRLMKDETKKKERQKTQQSSEEERVAKAVSRIYKNVKLSDAKKVVRLVYKHAKKQRIKPTLVVGLIASESGFRRTVVSSHGAVGYAQVMPKYHQDKIAGRDIFDPKVNIEVGVKILGDCLRKKKDINKALGCYNGATTSNGAMKYINQVRKNEKRIVKLASLNATKTIS